MDKKRKYTIYAVDFDGHYVRVYILESALRTWCLLSI